MHGGSLTQTEQVVFMDLGIYVIIIEEKETMNYLGGVGRGKWGRGWQGEMEEGGNFVIIILKNYYKK